MERFTRDSVATLVGAGLARVDSLVAAGRRLTVSVEFVVDDRLVGDSTALDPDYSQFGPGQAMIAHLLEHCRETGVREVDMRAGDFPYKQRWANSSIRTHSLALTPPGRQGDALLQARRVAMSVRARRLSRLAAG